MLVFTEDAWQLCAAQAVAINENLSYALVKYKSEYLILAEKRIGEFVSRLSRSSENAFKTLMVFGGDVLSGMTFERPFFPSSGELPVSNNGLLTSTFGTGLHTVTPAHNVESLRLSYAYKLSRDGCVDSKTGTLT